MSLISFNIMWGGLYTPEYVCMHGVGNRHISAVALHLNSKSVILNSKSFILNSVCNFHYAKIKQCFFFLSLKISQIYGFDNCKFY